MRKEKYKRNFIKDRDFKIIDLCKGKKVLHIWACDSPFTEEKYDNKTLLFEKIEKVSEEQLGIDIDKKMIDYLNSKYWDNKIIYFDMNKLQNLNFNPDIIIFWEVIEHLMNLEIALNNIKKIMNKKTLFVISTPNAFRIRNFLRATLWYELYHEDHKVLFSMWYLKNLLKFNKLEVNWEYFTTLTRNFKNYSLFRIFFKYILYYTELFINKIIPSSSETLLIICKLKK